MGEMARQGYWQADAATVDELKARYTDLAQRFDVRTSNTTFQEFVGLSGYGLGQAVDGAVTAATPASAHPATAAPPSAAPAEARPSEPSAPPLIEGMKLEKVSEPVVQALSTMLLLAMGVLLMTPAIGAWRQWRKA